MANITEGAERVQLERQPPLLPNGAAIARRGEAHQAALATALGQLERVVSNLVALLEHCVR